MCRPSGNVARVWGLRYMSSAGSGCWAAVLPAAPRLKMSKNIQRQFLIQLTGDLILETHLGGGGHRGPYFTAARTPATMALCASPSSLPVAAGQAEFWTIIRCSAGKVVIDWPK